MVLVNIHPEHSRHTTHNLPDLVSKKERMTLTLGLDLAGSEKRDTGLCLLHNKKIILVGVVHSNSEILTFVNTYKPDIIAIDAPLTLPKGRASIEIKNNKHFRICDLKLKKLGIKFFPITLGPMRKLTSRGMKLKKILSKKYKVIEVYPGAAYDIYNVKRKDYAAIRKLLKNLKLSSLPKRKLSCLLYTSPSPRD